MNLNKKQVGALLKVISKDDSRPVLTTAKVDKWGDDIVLVATDGYVLVALQLDKEDGAELVGKLIRREAIERWYKLATGKSRLDTRELVEVSNEDYGQHGEYANYDYPQWQQLIKSHDVEVGEIAFNADYAKVLQDLDGSDGLRYELNGSLAPMIANTERGTYVLMPRKK